MGNAGGLQVLHLQSAGSCPLFANKPQVGYGIVCGFGPCIAHFPELTPGGVTVAITANDVLHGREVVAEVLNEVLVQFGYTASWPLVPLRVWADAALLARSPDVEPLLQSFGGLQALKKAIDDHRRGSAMEQDKSGCVVGIKNWCRSVPLGCFAGVLSRG